MLVQCQCCQKEFNKAPSEIKKSPNHFCSRSCAAKSNNRKFHKRISVVSTECACGKRIRKTSKYCMKCQKIATRKERGAATIGDKTYDNHKYAKYSYIRYSAREVAKENGMDSCKNCGYKKCVEVCHIKPIHTYSPETTISEVNDISNLITLCPNCHWEFDHGDLTLEQINGAAEARTRDESLKATCFSS